MSPQESASFISKSSAALDNLPRRGYNIKVEYAPVCWNWQTRRTQNPLVVTPYGFDPHHRHKNKFPQLYPGWGTYFYFPVLRGRTARSRRSGTQISPVGCLRGRGRPPSPAPIVPKWFLPLRYFLFGRHLFLLSAKLSAPNSVRFRGYFGRFLAL